MPAATITSKGQITIPKAIRELLGLKPGNRLVFVPRPNGEVIVKAETVDVRSLRGMLKHDGPAVSVEEMNKAIAQSAAS
ncbi:MAG: type II toxin-antitoxin system PrlF family antitoxin [Deltaproteobacteria bacterium]|nr:type II toxin-antitoxin system PrlF family antitoxin [Deltaproteobacteria bacterium]